MKSPTKKQLIINADGFGFTAGNNRGILECIEAGTITSVSVNSNFPPFDEVGGLAERFPQVSIGVHLDLSVGPCVSDSSRIPDLVNEEGQFLGAGFRKKALRGEIPHAQMVEELTAQVARFHDLGISLTHWDSHQNQHLYPPFFRAATEVCRRFGILRMRTHRHYLFDVDPGRFLRATAHLLMNPERLATYAATRLQMIKARQAGMSMADRLITAGLIGNLKKTDRAFWTALFHHLPPGRSEVYCHPGYPDAALEANAAYVQERRLELEILRDPRLREEAEDAGVELISFRDIPIHPREVGPPAVLPDATQP